ncbi:hypothetical protein [Marinifilum flexuosum]|uniref:Uncharacterized protein n=1 Tax=Marinifilum flexuosum TaxID=1117708 RepID=A0A419X3L4_9BACT|nr:hypothetical protein [Marinifilum flexuosum]RKE02344.1 hypothetical protein BXY64_2432 [Marinifilum flexuosum]
MDLEELLAKKRRGDVALVAEMIGESLNNTGKILRSEEKKKHKEAVAALGKIIANREYLIKGTENSEEETTEK